MTDHYLIYDLETIPMEWESFSESQQEYLLRNAETEEERQKKKSEFALSPLTGSIVCLGLQMMELRDREYVLAKRAAYSVSPDPQPKKADMRILETGSECYICTEKVLLENFWKILMKYSNIHLISFNGRNFDAPYLMVRSALHGIRPSRNLMSGTKFTYPLHTDLIDELTYYNPGAYGATRRFNFDFYTRAFGIKSPKSEGVDGSKVAEYFKAGRIEEIAEYCLRDVKATWELYEIWTKYLNFNPSAK